MISLHTVLTMLGFQKFVAEQPILRRSGIRLIAITTSLIVTVVLAFLNFEISPRRLTSLDNENISSPEYLQRENSSDPERNTPVTEFISSPYERDKVNPSFESMQSSNFPTLEKNSDPATNTSETDFVSLISDQQKVNESIGMQSVRSPENSSVKKQTIAMAELTSCEKRRFPLVDRKIRTSPVTIREMDQTLSNNRRLPCSMIPRWSSPIDAQIQRARREIENTAIVKKHPRIYAPVFRNISMFKRSYELMEKILKVYVYEEGESPIFHSPYLSGIYSSESWFMKNMEESRHFRIQDPKKAHLFYLPFSSKLLSTKLYIPNSHSHKNIDQYLKNYVAEIASKYPFWNRTGGADHFLVACHDWAPLETQEVMGSTIRALCNSDLSTVYELGKDVAFPQTNVFHAKNPEMGLGGFPARERPILAFFAGKMHGYLRPLLLEKWGNGDPHIKVFGPMGRRDPKQNTTMSYGEYMKRSRFCICPRGFEVSSPRVMEAIFHECVPVIISDNFVPPFFEILKWEEFSVVVKEADIPRLKEILLSIKRRKYLALQASVRKVQKHFVWHNLPQRYDAFHMTLHSIWLNRVFQFKAN